MPWVLFLFRLRLDSLFIARQVELPETHWVKPDVIEDIRDWVLQGAVRTCLREESSVKIKWKIKCMESNFSYFRSPENAE